MTDTCSCIDMGIQCTAEAVGYAIVTRNGATESYAPLCEDHAQLIRTMEDE